MHIFACHQSVVCWVFQQAPAFIKTLEENICLRRFLYSLESSLKTKYIHVTIKLQLLKHHLFAIGVTNRIASS